MANWNSSNIKYSVIIPMYNEEAVIQETYRRIKKVMSAEGESYELIFVNDGSSDACAAIVRDYAAWDATVKLIDFSRNFGHQIAITAGMDYAAGEAVIIIDADLQDPPELIRAMIERWREGYEVVYAQRVKRKGESLFKKWSAAAFYRVLRSASETPIPLDTGDFRLMDRKVVNELKKLPESNRFVRGLVSWVGFRQIAVPFERDERLAGETKYPLKRMLKLSLDGLTSFSGKPLKLASYLGGLFTGVGLLSLLYAAGEALFTRFSAPEWAPLAGLMLFCSGIVLLILGVLGEYVGRIYEEAKGRPLYIVRETKGFEAIKAKAQEPASFGRP